MPNMMEKIPPDIELIGEIIVALNIFSRNAGIYPRNHPAVDTSLSRTFDLFQKIFVRRHDLTMAVGKDTLIIENYSLDKNNPSYRQFAGLFNKLNIAYVTFLRGCTKEELYAFQYFVSQQLRDLSPDDIQKVLSNHALTHIQIRFADYSSFSIEEGKTSEEISQENIWEMYILGLISGTQKMDELDEIPSAIFPKIVNKIHKTAFDKTSTEKIFTIYLQKLLQRPFSNENMKKLLDFSNGLQPDLGGQFLSLAVDMLSKSITLADKSLDNVAPDLVITLFQAIRSQKISIPDSLSNLLGKLLSPAQEDNDPLNLRSSSFVDDIFLPPDMLDILSRGVLERTVSDPFETSVSDEYQRDLQKLADFNAPEKFSISPAKLKRDCDDDYIDKVYYLTIFELMTSDVVSEEEYRQFIHSLKEQTSQFMSTGQYGQVLQIIKLLRLNIEKNKFADITSEALKNYYTEDFFLAFIASLKIIGRQARNEAWELCEFYGEMIIPFLATALVDEDSKTFRSLLMGFLKLFGEQVAPVALKGLNDTRWFVKRNMLSLLIGCKNKEIIPHVRPYCRHENGKVRLEAIKCLLSLQDDYGFEVLKQFLRSGSKEDVEQAISLIGSFRVKEALIDLIQMLRGQGTIKTDLEQKLSIIQVLGNIGDPRCLEAFREILSSKSFFFKRKIEKMKEEVYKTLKNFSYGDVEDIVQRGLRSRNKYINEESLRLSRISDR